MNEELERRARAVFDEIVDLPVEQRAAAIVEKCGNDAELLAQVQSLEEALRHSDEFMESPTLADQTTTAGQPSASPAEGPGSIIGPYKLLQEIGHGGFGVVYMAEQSVPVKRRVALKVIKQGMDTREVIARFEAERQALAMMDHPNIARVFDAGATAAGRPYFVMELVHGVPITEYCDANHLTARERLELMVPVCRALQSAHQKGVIHRDLKPSNVMVTMHDGKPVPKVIDFGIAKATGQSLTDRTLFTAFHQFIGTPAYMSPEQAEMSGLDIDTRADVYGLGVLLYELLTGTTPVDPKVLKAAAYAEMARLIRDTEPSKPSTKLSTLGGTLSAVAGSRGTDGKKLGQIVRGELDWIVMKAIEKDRTRRYDTAAALADDLGRYLAGDAVSAGPPGGVYRLRKVLRQHKAAIAIAASILFVLSLGVAGTTIGLVRESRQRKVADAMRLTADEQRNSAQAIVDFLTHDVLERATPYSTQDIKVSDALVKSMIEPAIKIVNERFEKQPLVKAAIQETLAEVLGSLDRPKLEYEQAQAAYNTRRALLGEDASETLISLNRTADALRQQDRYDDAYPLAKSFYERSKAKLGEDNRLTIEALGNYAMTLQGMGKGHEAEAETLSRQAWEQSERVLGEQQSDTILAMNNYASMLAGQGNFEKAAALHKRVWEWDAHAMGDDNPHTIVALMSYAVDLASLGRDSEAQPLCVQAVERTTRVLGNDNRYTCRALTNYAALLSHEGNNAEAEEPARRSWEQSHRLFGDDHSDTFSALQNYAVVLQALGRPEAAPRLMDVWHWLQKHAGEDDPKTITAGQNYGITLSRLGQTDDAIAVLRQSLDTCRRARPGDDDYSSNALSALGRCLAGKGPAEADEAERDLREAMSMRSNLHGAKDDSTARSARALADLLDKTGRSAEAAKIRAEHGIAPTSLP